MSKLKEETRAYGNGLVFLYILFVFGALFSGLSVSWGIVGVLGMAFLTYAITPAYPGIVKVYNYLYFGFLVISIIFRSALIPGLLVTLGPIMVLGVPISHILYLSLQGLLEKSPDESSVDGEREDKSSSLGGGKSVLDGLGKKIALVCGYETISAKKAITYLTSRTVLSWVLTSFVMILLARFGFFN